MSNYPPRLTPGDVKYLALEGGGGKGNAFVGALESLAHSSLNVIQNSGYRLTNIRGVAGASAGAITALFLAAGFTPFELKTITELEDFNQFFDGPHPGRVFRIGGFQNHPRTSALTAALVDMVREALELLKDLDVTRIASYVARRVRVGDIVRGLTDLRDLLESLPSGSDPVEAARRIQEIIERLTRLGLEDTVSALQAVRELLTALPAAVWLHIAQLCILHNRLARLSVQSVVLMVILGNINQFLWILRSLMTDDMYRQILDRDATETATAIVQDFGVLTGEEIYKFFRRWLAVARLRIHAPADYERYVPAGTSREDLPARFAALKAVVESGSDAELTRYRDDNMTFEAFEREFQMKLAFAGTNLESLTSHMFSGATTPRFYVVDAVRLSMALPYCIFKPLIIREDDPALPNVIAPGESLRERDPVSGNNERHPLIGVWIDGGTLNNIPSHAFDRQADEDRRVERERARAERRDPDAIRVETLALRLESSFQMQPSSVTDLTDYFLQFPGGLAFGSGEALASRSYDNMYRSIALDTGNLNLLSFSPTPAESAPIRQSAIEYVFRYFDRPVPADL